MTRAVKKAGTAGALLHRRCATEGRFAAAVSQAAGRSARKQQGK
jgi:hypothetical protein